MADRVRRASKGEVPGAPPGSSAFVLLRQQLRTRTATELQRLFLQMVDKNYAEVLTAADRCGPAGERVSSLDAVVLHDFSSMSRQDFVTRLVLHGLGFVDMDGTVLHTERILPYPWRLMPKVAVKLAAFHANRVERRAAQRALFAADAALRQQQYGSGDAGDPILLQDSQDPWDLGADRAALVSSMQAGVGLAGTDPANRTAVGLNGVGSGLGLGGGSSGAGTSGLGGGGPGSGGQGGVVVVDRVVGGVA